MLKISNLHATRNGKTILNGVNLSLKSGDIQALMGPNGSGKSTLAMALMGHPDIVLTKGSIKLDGVELKGLKPNKRSNLGLFLAFQYPIEVSGVPYLEFLRLSHNSILKTRGEKELSPIKFRKLAIRKMDALHIDQKFLKRNLNENFSGGEKKKSEILQMAILEPKYAILDETDSGLDVSALKIVAEGVNKISKETNAGVLVITHYPRIMEYLKPSRVHILVEGEIVKSGGPSLAKELDKTGYDEYI